MKNPLISNEVRELGGLLIDNALNSVQTGYTYTCGNIQIWTSNGLLFINLYSGGSGMGTFNIFEKFYISKCIRKAKIKKTLHELQLQRTKTTN